MQCTVGIASNSLIVDPLVASADRIFWRALGITTILKLLIAALIPLTGDEAYFVIWGEHLDYGYYDHGAMTGWWLAAVLSIGKSVLLVRLPAVLTTVAIGLLLWRTLRSIDAQKAGWVAALYLWSPHSMANIFMTTDTPLIFFSAVSGVFAFRACREDRKIDYLLCGVFLGLAFLSKYFAVLLGLSYAVLFLFCIGRPRVVGLLIIFVGVLPFAAINVLWNYNHGWTNIVFNFYTRQQEAHVSILTVVTFIGTTLLLIGPLAWPLFAPRFQDRYPVARARQNWRHTGLIAFVIAFVVPHFVLLIVSFNNRIGLHWSLSFYPFLFAVLPGLFALGALARIARGMAVVGGITFIVMMIVALLPVEVARRHPSYASVVISNHADEVLAKLKAIKPDSLITTPSYSKSSLLSFHHDQYVPVIGNGSFHARQDDLITDVRTLENRDVLVLTHKQEQADECLRWFDRTEILQFEVRGAQFYVVDGRSFRYASYRRRILRKVVNDYYQPPEWLARRSPPSPFLERYDLVESKP
ncbi:MAG TPA: glycosyltransferase family 39 protein [Tepidisphaeraceae bacterium]|nr:glycosyltransferase family 39 protein [Tepidisphaeraceae bacterium]